VTWTGVAATTLTRPAVERPWAFAIIIDPRSDGHLSISLYGPLVEDSDTNNKEQQAPTRHSFIINQNQTNVLFCFKSSDVHRLSISKKISVRSTVTTLRYHRSIAACFSFPLRVSLLHVQPPSIIHASNDGFIFFSIRKLSRV
jgi:hypothetical protein